MYWSLFKPWGNVELFNVVYVSDRCNLSLKHLILFRLCSQTELCCFHSPVNSARQTQLRNCLKLMVHECVSVERQRREKLPLYKPTSASLHFTDHRLTILHCEWFKLFRN